MTVTSLSKILGVSRKGYYKYKPSQVDEATKSSAVLYYCQSIRTVLPNAGIDKLQACCNQYFEGEFTVGRDWLYSLLGANDMLLKKRKRKAPPKTTMGVVNHGFADHVNTTPKYIASAPCRLVVSDITYVKYRDGFAYLSLTMDAFCRVITGASLQKTLSTDGPMRALRSTVAFYKKLNLDVNGLIFHTDRGCQYVSHEMTDYEASLGIVTSVTQCGNPLHNAMAERLNETIKNEWLYGCEDLSFEETEKEMMRRIHLYNYARPHRAIKNATPMQALIPGFPNPLVCLDKKECKRQQLEAECKFKQRSLEKIAE